MKRHVYVINIGNSHLIAPKWRVQTKVWLALHASNDELTI